jgi:deoxyribose-phosphate aldolase
MNVFIDHTLLKPDATMQEIKTLCDEAMAYKFASVCVNPCHVEFAKTELEQSDVKVCTVIGFPLGANSTAAKCFETELALKHGADEFDMVINVGWIKEKMYEKITSEINQLKELIGNRILKVIVEISLLSEDEIIRISKIVSKSNADYIKTSTGFGAHGATLEAVKLFKENISTSTKIKASGGIRDYKTAKAYIDLGVSRIGTSSSIKIMKEYKTNEA